MRQMTFSHQVVTCCTLISLVTVRWTMVVVDSLYPKSPAECSFIVEAKFVRTFSSAACRSRLGYSDAFSRKARYQRNGRYLPAAVEVGRCLFRWVSMCYCGKRAERR